MGPPNHKLVERYSFYAFPPGGFARAAIAMARLLKRSIEHYPTNSGFSTTSLTPFCETVDKSFLRTTAGAFMCKGSAPLSDLQRPWTSETPTYYYLSAHRVIISAGVDY